MVMGPLVSPQTCYTNDINVSDFKTTDIVMALRCFLDKELNFRAAKQVLSESPYFSYGLSLDRMLTVESSWF